MLNYQRPLQKMNVPSRLIIYSNAGHWPGWYEMAFYYTAHLEWFRQHLGGDAPLWTSEQFLRNAVFDRESGGRFGEEPKRQTEPDQAPVNRQGKPDAKPVTP